MNILHINSGYADTSLYLNLTKEISNQHEQSIYIPLKKKKEVKKENSNEKVKYYYSSLLSPVWSRLDYFGKIKTIEKDIISKVNIEDHDLIHAHFLFSNGGVAYKLKKKFGIPYITAVRNTDINIFFKYFRHTRKFIYEVLLNAEYIVFISPAYKTMLLSMLPSKISSQISEKCCVIPNGIDDFWIKNRGKTKQISDNTINFLFVGETSENKNIHKSIEVLKKLNKNTDYKISFTIVPKNGNYHEKIEKLAQNTDFVTLLETIYDKNELQKHYRNADIFIMPSRHETFGLVYIEAMSQGTPVIYSLRQGIDGFFEPGNVGFPVNVDNKLETIEKIQIIIDNYSNTSQNCINETPSFSWQSIVNKYYDLYNKIG